MEFGKSHGHSWVHIVYVYICYRDGQASVQSMNEVGEVSIDVSSLVNAGGRTIYDLDVDPRHQPATLEPSRPSAHAQSYSRWSSPSS